VNRASLSRSAVCRTRSSPCDTRMPALCPEPAVLADRVARRRGWSEVRRCPCNSSQALLTRTRLPFPPRPHPTGHGVFLQPARDTGISAAAFPGFDHRTGARPAYAVYSDSRLTLHFRPLHAVSSLSSTRLSTESQPRAGTTCVQRSFAPAACCCSAILATTDLSCHSRSTPQLPASQLYGGPCHTGVYWLVPRASPFDTPILSHHAMLFDPGESDECTYPVLPRRLQPSPGNKGLGTPDDPPSTSSGGPISRLNRTAWW
jgi:hypothetical protein